MTGLELLKKLVTFPSVSADPAYFASMAEVRDFLCGELQELGFQTEAVETQGHPVVFAKRLVDPSRPTVLLYGHYDVQPPDPLDQWTSAAFAPEQRGDRLYGRGSADNKGSVAVYLTAIKECLDAGIELPNIKLVIEGEEEVGSPSFLPFLEARKDDLQADVALVSDSGSPELDQLVVTCGLRGMACLEVQLTGPSSDLHSGLFGGAVVNPLMALSQILASLHGPDGEVLVPGFYDGIEPVEEWEKEELKRAGFRSEALKEFLGVDALYSSPGFSPVESIRFAPTLECNGIGGGYQGAGSKTVIPSKAFAKISCRLVPGQDPVKVQNAVVKALEDRCPAGLKVSFLKEHTARAYAVSPAHKSGKPLITPVDRAFYTMSSVVKEITGNEPLFIREGGSIPIIADIKTVLGLDTILLGLFLPEDRLHAPDESFHLGMFERGVKIYREMLRKLAEK